MDVTLRNELTRPYKIPRKRSDEKNDGSDSGKPAIKHNSPLKTAPEVYQSPVSSLSQRMQPSTSTGMRANVPKTTTQPRPTPPRANNVTVPRGRPTTSQVKPMTNSKPMAEKRKVATNAKPKEVLEPATTTLDIIMNEMKSLEKDTKKKKKPIRPDSPVATDENSPSTSKQYPSSHLTSAYAPLTRIELMRNENDEILVYNFLRKETGIMEVILGFKMLKGRVEPYAVEHYAPLISQGKPRKEMPAHMNHPVVDAAPSPSMEAIRKGPKTPPGPGPRTPPGPGPQTPAESESVQSNRPSSPRSDVQQRSCSPLPPPPTFPNFVADHEQETKQDRKSELLKEMSQLTNTPMNQLEANLGTELQNAIDRDIDRSTIFNTLKDALRNMGQKPGDAQAKTNLDESQETQKATDAMSISSGDSRNNDLLPPPPPPPLSPPPPPPGGGNLQRPPTPPPSTPPNADFMLQPKDEVHASTSTPLMVQQPEVMAVPRFDMFPPTFVTSIAPNTMPTAIIIADPSLLMGASGIPVSATTLITSCPPTTMAPQSTMPILAPSSQPMVMPGMGMPEMLPNQRMPCVHSSFVPNMSVPPPNMQMISPSNILAGPNSGVMIPGPSSPKRTKVEGENWKTIKKPAAKIETAIDLEMIRSRPPPMLPEMAKNVPPPMVNPVQNAQPTMQPNAQLNPMAPSQPMPNFSLPPPSFAAPPSSANPSNGPPPMPSLNVPPPSHPSMFAPPTMANQTNFHFGMHCSDPDFPQKQMSSKQFDRTFSSPPAPSFVPSNSASQPMDMSPMKPIVSMTNSNDDAKLRPIGIPDMSVPPPSLPMPSVAVSVDKPLPETNLFKTLMSALSKQVQSAQESIEAKSSSETPALQSAPKPTGPPVPLMDLKIDPKAFDPKTKREELFKSSKVKEEPPNKAKDVDTTWTNASRNSAPKIEPQVEPSSNMNEVTSPWNAPPPRPDAPSMLMPPMPHPMHNRFPFDPVSQRPARFPYPMPPNRMPFPPFPPSGENRMPFPVGPPVPQGPPGPLGVPPYPHMPLRGMPPFRPSNTPPWQTPHQYK